MAQFGTSRGGYGKPGYGWSYRSTYVPPAAGYEPPGERVYRSIVPIPGKGPWGHYPPTGRVPSWAERAARRQRRLGMRLLPVVALELLRDYLTPVWQVPDEMLVNPNGWTLSCQTEMPVCYRGSAFGSIVAQPRLVCSRSGLLSPPAAWSSGKTAELWTSPIPSVCDDPASFKRYRRTADRSDMTAEKAALRPGVMPIVIPLQNPMIDPAAAPIINAMPQPRPLTVRTVWKLPDRDQWTQTERGPWTKPRDDGDDPPWLPPHEHNRPTRGTTERKERIMPLPRWMQKAIGVSSETMDAVDCWFDALGGRAPPPSGYHHKGRGARPHANPIERILWVKDNIGYATNEQITNALVCMAMNNAQDWAIGKAARWGRHSSHQAQWATRKANWMAKRWST